LVSAQKRLINQALPKTQSTLAGSLEQLFRIDCGIDLIVKTHKESIITFGHCAFITSQWLFVPTNMVL